MGASLCLKEPAFLQNASEDIKEEDVPQVARHLTSRFSFYFPCREWLDEASTIAMFISNPRHGPANFAVASSSRNKTTRTKERVRYA